MHTKDMLQISGVFAAVKCAICDTIYPADSDDFVALYGSIGVGLDRILVGVSPPKKPAKKAVSVVCRSPGCMRGLVRSLLGCDGEKGDAERLWAQVLKIWAEDAGHTLVERPETKAAPPKKKLRRA